MVIHIGTNFGHFDEAMCHNNHLCLTEMICHKGLISLPFAHKLDV